MIQFKDFPTGNESGKFLVNPFWLEHLLNLFNQGYICELWEEIQDTIFNHTNTIRNTSFGIIGMNLNKEQMKFHHLEC